MSTTNTPAYQGETLKKDLPGVPGSNGAPDNDVTQSDGGLHPASMGNQDGATTPSGKHKKPAWPELPAAPAPKLYGHGWGPHHKIPTTSDYKDIQQKHDQDAEDYQRLLQERADADDTDLSSAASSIESELAKGEHGRQDQNPNKGATEKQRMMDQMNANQEKPTERAKKAEKGERRVRDPITGRPMVVKDADPKDFDTQHTRIMGSNILYHEFPPPAPPHLKEMIKKLHNLQYAIIGCVAVLWFFVAWGSGIMRFIWRTTLCAIAIGVLCTMVNLAERNLEKEVQNVRADQHRQRGQAMVPPTPESVEWLNNLIQLIWGLIDPAMFVPIADMLEDILQQSLPGFVDAVRITDVGQGTNPLRITSIRALPDQPGDKGYPKTDWIDKGENLGMKDTGGKPIDEDQAGDYYNFELAFSYSAKPGGGSERAKNIHLLIEFFLGAYDWFHIPVPIWIQIEQIFGVVRLRVQFVPEAPFVRNVTFALCGVPSVEVSAIPMSRMLPNVLDLPFVSGFVKDGIAAGTTTLAAPQSMTINVGDILTGAGAGDTHAKGVFVVVVHYCEGLGAQDSNGKSDPYIVLAYAKYGRPLYSTRIITEDLNPVYEETAFLLVSEDEVRAEEDVCAMLWDSDKMSAESDLVGRVQIPVLELMENANKMIRREDGLMGFDDGNEMPGKLIWSIGYFDKAELSKDLERLPTLEEAKANAGGPAPTSKAITQDDAAPNPAREDLPPPPAEPTKTRPDPRWPSGILSIILHQVNNLERQQLEGKKGDEREGEAGQDTDDPSEQTNNLPSGYGEFIVNDTMVYKTRVKQYTTNPYFEAGNEIFIRDFTTTEVRVVIRDSRLRENDPILGVITVNLRDMFAESSSVTQTFPIQEGVGFGKANISFAFRGVKTTLPDNLRGWDTGTLTLSQVRLTSDPSKKDTWEAKETQLVVSTNESTSKMKKRHAEMEGNEVIWDEEPLHLPVYSRYQAHVWFEFGSSGLGSLVGKGKPQAVAIMWLQDLTDWVEGEVEIPVLVGENMDNLKLNVINDQTLKHHKFEVVGTVRARMQFTPGLDLYHEELRLSQGRRHALQAWMAVEGEAVLAEREQAFKEDGNIDEKEKKEMKKLHRRQLESRGRGAAQVGAFRSARWLGKGLIDRLPGKKKTREPSVQTEA